MARTRKPASEPPESVEELAFEGALDQLDSLVDRLESGDLSLEDSLATYERGVALSRRCAELLASAEQRIDELVGEGDSTRVQPFEPSDTEEG